MATAPTCLADSEGCCLELYETLLILTALVLLVQVALKVVALVGYYLCYLLRKLSEMVVGKESEKPKPAPRRGHGWKASPRWSESDIPYRRRWESPPPHPRCLRCTLEPVKLTIKNGHFPCKEHQRVGRRAYREYPPPNHTPHCEHCECEHHCRARNTSAPAAYVTRLRDVACGNSDPMLASGNDEWRNVPPSNEPFPRTQVGETQYHGLGAYADNDYQGSGGPPRARRPTKVYIYPVHPQTPPGSRSASPERSHRRRGALAAEDMAEYEPRERRRTRDTEPQGGGASPALTRFQNAATNIAAAIQTDAPNTKPRHAWPEPGAGSEWVYRTLK